MAQSELDVSGKPFEVGVYMKMLNSDDVAAQRNAARAVYHERRVDADLLAMIADQLTAAYLQEGLSGQQQDTLAWYAKTLGNNARDDYRELLVEVAEKTPSKKLRKHALKASR